MSSELIAPTLRLLQQNLTHHFQDLSQLCEHNKYILKFIDILAQHKDKQIVSDSEDDNDYNMQ
jgi:hypothetical protein